MSRTPHTHARTQKVYYLEIWNNCFCRMSSKSRTRTLLSLSFIPLSYLSPSFSLPPPSPLCFPFCVPLSPSRRSFKQTRVVPPGLVPGVLPWQPIHRPPSQQGAWPRLGTLDWTLGSTDCNSRSVLSQGALCCPLLSLCWSLPQSR